MPRRGGSGGSRCSPPSGSRGYSTPAKPPPPPTPPPKSTAAKQPSMMRQMAATAGGVAVGTVLGHAMISALSPRERVPYYEDTYARASSQDLSDDPCGQMLKNLISCMRMAQETGTDVTNICTQAEKQYLGCRERNGDPTY